MSWVARYKLSLIDLEEVARVAVADLRGGLESDVATATRRWLEAEILAYVAPRAREAIAFHRERGHVLAILSSSTPYLTEPLAAHLGIEHVLCTRLHVEEGRFSGTYERPACYGRGKVH